MPLYNNMYKGFFMAEQYIFQETHENGHRNYFHVKRKRKKFPSVTTIISKYEDYSGLQKWKDKIGEEKARELTQAAAKSGAKIHRANEGKKVELTPKEQIVQNRHQSLIDNIQTIERERPILWIDTMDITGKRGGSLSDGFIEVGFGGTFDCLALVDKSKLIDEFDVPLANNVSSFFIVDWKTKRKLPNPEYLISYYLQAAAYAAGLNRNTDKKYKCNEALIALATTRSLALYYLSPKEILFYWRNFLEMVRCYFHNDVFDWHSFKSESKEHIAEDFSTVSYLGERVYLRKNL